MTQRAFGIGLALACVLWTLAAHAEAPSSAAPQRAAPAPSPAAPHTIQPGAAPAAVPAPAPPGHAAHPAPPPGFIPIGGALGGPPRTGSPVARPHSPLPVFGSGPAQPAAVPEVSPRPASPPSADPAAAAPRPGGVPPGFVAPPSPAFAEVCDVFGIGTVYVDAGRQVVRPLGGTSYEVVGRGEPPADPVACREELVLPHARLCVARDGAMSNREGIGPPPPMGLCRPVLR
jgi:hypothetical protein